MTARERLAWALLLALNVATHFADLGARAMGHDESLHAFYSHQYATTGVYKHDPMMHGPFLFHSTGLVFLLAGTNDTTARLLPALFGTLLVATLFAFRRYLGRRGAFFAAVLASLSPVLLVYARYLRNDIYVSVFTLLWVLGLLRFQDTRKVRWLWLTSFAMSISFCSKETTFITGAILGAWFALRGLVRAFVRREPFGLNRDAEAALVMLSLALPFASPLVHTALGWNPEQFEGPLAQVHAAAAIGLALALGAGIAFVGLKRAPLGFKAWTRLLAMFWFLPVFLFSALFTDMPRGIISGVVGSLGYWLGQHSVGRGSQPWFYYAFLTVLYEFLPLVLASCGAIAVLRRLAARRLPRVPAFLLFWTVGAALLYSVAGERMPWLNDHIVLPMTLLGGWWLGRYVSRVPWAGIDRLRGLAVFVSVPLALLLLARLAWLRPFADRSLTALAESGVFLTLAVFLIAVGLVARACARGMTGRQARSVSLLGGFALLAVLTARAAFTLTFVNYDMATEFLAYSHGTPDVKRMLAEVEEVADRTGVGSDLVVAADDDTAWPLTWYLRVYPKQAFYADTPTLEAMRSPVVIVGSKNLPAAEPYLERDYVKRDYRLVWWPIEDYAGIDLDTILATLADPEARRRVWNIAVHRRYDGVSLAEWPYRHEFKLFVRRDLARDVWPLGQEALAAAAPEAQAAPVPELRCAARGVYEGAFGDKPLAAPAAVALGADGTRWIADTGHHRVVKLDASGRFLASLGSACDLGKGAASGCRDAEAHGQFAEPWGVAVGRGGELIVADTWNGRLQFFDSKGAFLRSWGRLVMNAPLPIPTDNLYGPRAVASDAKRERLFVTDTGNKRVLVLAPDGGVLAELSGGFDEPVGVAVSPRDGHVFVADTWNQRIQQFDADLEFVASWAVPGWKSRSLTNKPYLAVDDRGLVYASDPDAGRVLVFGPEGQPVASLAATEWHGADVGPTGLALDGRRKILLVTDTAGNKVWSLPQVTLADGTATCLAASRSGH